MSIPTPTPLRDLLGELAQAVGRPVASVYLPLPSASEDAAQQYDVRRRNLADQLRAAGADDALLEVVSQALSDRQHDDGATLVLVADAERVLLDRTLSRGLPTEVVSVGLVPALLPALRAEQDDLDHVAVLLDRTGADVWVRSTLDHVEQTTQVEGDTEHVHRGAPGGWSQRRFQQRAENTWEHNASDVIAELLELVDLERMERIVIAGDVRAVGFFTDHLPVKAKERLIVVDGSRHSDHEAFLHAADVAVRTTAKEHEVGDIHQLQEDLAVGTAVEGLEVLSLLAQGRVDRLFVADDTRSPERLQVPFTLDPFLAGSMAQEMSATTTAPAGDLAVLMAAGMGTSVHVLPGHGARLPADGLGARLRG